ncbi:MAG: N-6 DNA methylase [Planctomycetales bacterium]
MAKEFFAHTETRQLFQTVEDVCRRSSVSRGQAFEDLLRASVAALAAETMEEDYLDAIKAHTAGAKGKRGVDLFPEFFAQLVEAMNGNDADILGDLFQGAISYGENGLYLTPPAVSRLMAALTVGPEVSDPDGAAPLIHDPCCGTGILLMDAGQASPRAELVGQDIDPRCARITSINLGLRGKYGWVICGNTLSREVQFVYRIANFFHEGPNGRRRGVIRQVPAEACPLLPEIMRGTRQDVRERLESTTEPAAPAESMPPRIIEVPQWLWWLEQRMTKAQEAMLPPKRGEDSPPAAETDQESRTEEGSTTQGRLFD